MHVLYGDVDVILCQYCIVFVSIFEKGSMPSGWWSSSLQAVRSQLSALAESKNL